MRNNERQSKVEVGKGIGKGKNEYSIGINIVYRVHTYLSYVKTGLSIVNGSNEIKRRWRADCDR